MAKVYYLLRKKRWREVATVLSTGYSSPEINHCLAIYFKRNQLIFELNFINHECYLRSYDKSPQPLNHYLSQIHVTPSIRVENEHIKYLLKICHQLQLNKAIISQIVQLDFAKRDHVVNLQLGTIIGDLLIVDQSDEEKVRSLFATDLFFSERLTSSELNELIASKNLKTEEVFSSFDIPNPIIRNYCDRFAIDLSASADTISQRMGSKSNDYSLYEECFELFTSKRLASNDVSEAQDVAFKPLSIVVSSFNSENTIVKVLQSIQSQTLSLENKKLLDVIVVDDGSSKPVVDVLKPHLKKFSFRPTVIRLEMNQGLSSARNLGFQVSRYDHLLFIDSDILLSKNYLYEHSIRLQLIPNAVFISFKENISPESPLLSEDNILGGLPISTSINDKRLFRLRENDVRWRYKTVDEGAEEILSETNMFKSFGYGRTLNGCHDLPSMVIGHNMSMRKNIVRNAGGFSKNFSGWGLEDTFFGAKAIAQGNFIIPVMSTSVYHIDHPARSGSPEKQLIEHDANRKIYDALIRRKL